MGEHRLTYLSVCSGIEAVTVAWHALGYSPLAFSEIEPFPCAVLAIHYSDVPNYGDLTRFRDWPDATPDVLVGGTPCQSFSVAGLRAGLADPRGNLALTYLAVAERYRPRWVVWENVPGVLSADSHEAPGQCAPPDNLEEGSEWVGEDEYDADEDHAFACFLAGLSELGYRYAYRTLDAQYFGLAQRRRRVFVVGHLGDWRRAAAVLFERESLSGHPPPCREAGQAAPTLPSRRTAGGGLGTDFDCDGGLVASTLDAGPHGGNPLDKTLIPILDGAKGRGERGDGSRDGSALGKSGDPMFTLRKGSAHAIAFDTTQITSKANRSHPHPGDPCHPLAAMAHAPAVAFDWQSGGDSRGLDPKDTAQLQRCQVPAVAFQESQSGFRAADAHPTLDSHNGSRRHHGVMAGMQVRRLTPLECERLQGFPDDYTLIRYRGKPAADGPRYKALGNSMAVPVMRWIGRRIALVDAL